MCPGLLVCTRNEPIGLVIKRTNQFRIYDFIDQEQVVDVLQDILLDNFRVIAES